MPCDGGTRDYFLTQRVISPWGAGEPHSEIKLDSLTLSPDGTAVAYSAREAGRLGLGMKPWRLFLDDSQAGSFVEPILSGTEAVYDVGPIFLRQTDVGWRIQVWARTGTEGRKDWKLVSHEIGKRSQDAPSHSQYSSCAPRPSETKRVAAIVAGALVGSRPDVAHYFQELTFRG